MYKVRAVIEYIVDRFKSKYVPNEFVCIDEELLLWKGRVSFKQYIASKRSRFGIKLLSLCETSGYLWSSFVYLGSKGIITEDGRAMERLLGKSGAVVPKLMSDVFGKGYKLFVDNWYTSEKLFRYLEENGTAACGTARGTRLHLPKSFKKEPLQKVQYRFLRDENMLEVPFYFLSTIHSIVKVASGKSDKDGRSVKMLRLISDYNKHMGGVDKNNAMVGNYMGVRRSYKWTTKAFFHFIEEAVFNSFIFYKKCDGKKRFLQFKLNSI